MKKLIVFNEIPETLPEGFYSLGENDNGDTVFETKKELPTSARQAIADDVVGLNIFKSKKQQINSARDREINSTVTVEGIGILDSNVISTQRVMGALLLSMAVAFAMIIPVLLELCTTTQKKKINAAVGKFKTTWIDSSGQEIKDVGFNELLKIGTAFMQNTASNIFKTRIKKDQIAQSVIDEFKET